MFCFNSHDITYKKLLKEVMDNFRYNQRFLITESDGTETIIYNRSKEDALKYWARTTGKSVEGVNVRRMYRNNSHPRKDALSKELDKALKEFE